MLGSMPGTGERRRHYRERDAGGRVAVWHRPAGGPEQRFETLDIGAGGAFVIGATWPVGTAIALELDVDGQPAPLALTGVVRWTAGDGSADDVEAGAELPSGVGVQFLDLDLDVIFELNEQLARISLAAAMGADDDDDIPATD